MLSDPLDNLSILDALLGPEADPVTAGYRLRELAEGPSESGPAIIARLHQNQGVVGRSDPAILGGLLRVIHTLVLRDADRSLPVIDPFVVCQVESSLPAETPNRHLLLHLLAMNQSEESLRALVQRLHVDPPKKWLDAAQVLSPMMQRDNWPIHAVFPELLLCLQYPSLAAPLLDLANFLVRTGRVDEHPAVEQIDALNHLLGEVSNRLAKFEENPKSFGDEVEVVQATLSEAVALAVSLCDAVALIGDESSISKLNQTVELRHRRVQCEAAGALARFGDDLGKKRILELSEDPAARLRAIAYADELDFGDDIDEKFRTPESLAEAELALWLSQPQQMSVPPTGIEVIDSRRMMWPSFNDPVDVFLVRFEYNFGERSYSNVGIAGPVAFAFSTDVAELPVDDIYSIYAGWHADHPEIFTVAADQFNEAQTRAIEPFTQHLQHLGYEAIKPALLGFFLDEQAGVFTARRDHTDCVVVTDGLETVDHPIAGRLRPLSPDDIFNLFKGRKMIRTFNP
tara:strand:+ start:564839 stop:566380 length:1542 start_codon:yes stop_codon:yes gene_type:complete